MGPLFELLIISSRFFYQDINECLNDDLYSCTDDFHKCVNTRGSYKCECEQDLYFIDGKCKGNQLLFRKRHTFISLRERCWRNTYLTTGFWKDCIMYKQEPIFGYPLSIWMNSLRFYRIGLKYWELGSDTYSDLALVCAVTWCVYTNRTWTRITRNEERTQLFYL